MSKKIFIACTLIAFSFFASPSFAQHDRYSNENDDVYANSDDYNRNRDQRIDERRNRRNEQWTETEDRHYTTNREYVCRRGYHVNCRHDRYMHRHQHNRYRISRRSVPQSYCTTVWVAGHWQYGHNGHRYWVPGHHARRY